MHSDKVEVEKPVSTNPWFKAQAAIADKERNRIRIFFPGGFFTEIKIKPHNFDEAVRDFESRGIKVTFEPLSEIERKCACCGKLAD